MANQCEAIYRITGPEEDISRLETAIKEILTRASSDEGFADRPMTAGDIAEYLGKDNWCACDCRGEYFAFERQGDSITLCAITPWAPQHEPLLRLCDSISGRFNILYSAEEYNMHIYVTNDPDIAGKWTIDSWQDTEEYPKCMQELVRRDGYAGTEELKSALKEAFGYDGSVEELVSRAEALWNVHIAQFEYEDIRG